jgi:UPF0716 protein FxsA
MGKLLLIAFIVIPLAELYLLMQIGSVVGFWPTVALVLATGALGAWLARTEGSRVMRGWRAAIAEGRLPEEGVLGGALVLAGGVLLITPGVLTDALGISLLVPFTRRLWIRVVRRALERSIRSGRLHVTTLAGGGMGAPFSPRGRVIDVPGESVPKD